jgi:hypothetical protein
VDLMLSPTRLVLSFTHPLRALIALPKMRAVIVLLTLLCTMASAWEVTLHKYRDCGRGSPTNAEWVSFLFNS